MRKLVAVIVALVLSVMVIGVGFWIGLAMLDHSPIYNDLQHPKLYHPVNNNK